MKKIKLSKRLHKASEFVVPAQPILDVGSDHAYLPIYLVQENKISSAIAGEVAKGPYQNAKEKIAQYEQEDNISIRLGDGLEVLESTEPIGTVFICGMGGLLISDILKRGLENNKVPKGTRLVLQPNNTEEDLRKVLVEANYQIINEAIIEENDKIYEIIVAEYIENPIEYTEIEYRFGPKLMKEKSVTFNKKWTLEMKKLENILEKLSETENIGKIRNFEEKIQQIKQVIV